ASGILQRFRLDADTVIVGRHRIRAAGVVLVGAVGQAAATGARVRAAGDLRALPRLGPGGFEDYNAKLERDGVYARMDGASLATIRPPPRLDPAVALEAGRRAFAEALHRALPEPEATLLMGEVMGLRGALPPEADRDLVASGLV